MMERRCFHCGKVVESLAGDPGKWPHIIGLMDGTGIGRTFCGECASKAVMLLLESTDSGEGEHGKT